MTSLSYPLHRVHVVPSNRRLTPPPSPQIQRDYVIIKRLPALRDHRGKPKLNQDFNRSKPGLNRDYHRAKTGAELGLNYDYNRTKMARKQDKNQSKPGLNLG